MANTFLVWGAGGHGKVVADLVRACGQSIIGFVDSDETKLGREVEPGGAQVVMLEEQFLSKIREQRCYPTGVDAVVVAIGHNRTRQDCVRLLRPYTVPVTVHPSAIISPSARFGVGTVVFPGAVVNAGACIGEAVIVNTMAVIEHDCDVADGGHISPGAVLAGGVRLGERSWVGAGATILPGIVIGADVTVGAGAVVIRNVPDGAVVTGVPARPTQGA